MTVTADAHAQSTSNDPAGAGGGRGNQQTGPKPSGSGAGNDAAQPKGTSAQQDTAGSPAPTTAQQQQPASSQAPVPAPAEKGGHSSQGGATGIRSKKGICYNDSKFMSGWTSNDVSWAVNWSSYVKGEGQPDLPAGVQHVPMLWSNRDDHLKAWAANDATIAQAPVIFTFNEPNDDLCAEQACMTVEVAVKAWKEHIVKYARDGVTLVAPAVPQGPKGQTWLEEFFKACPPSECKQSAIALHWYEASTNIEYFKSYFQDAYKNEHYGGFPIWINEFQGLGDTAALGKFYQDVVPWLEEQDMIAGYSAFNLQEGILVTNGMRNQAASDYVAA